MSADLHLHVFTKEFTEEHYKVFESSCLGSKYFGYATNEDEKRLNCFNLCAKTPQVWVGEVSWLKAALFEDSKTFVPEPILIVAEIIGEDFPIIDDTLIQKIDKAMRIKNQTGYHIAKPEEVTSFLKQHKGKKVFKISW